MITDVVRSLLQLSSIDEELRVCREELEARPARLEVAEGAESALAARLADVEKVCAAERGRGVKCEADLGAVEKRLERATARIANLVSADQIAACDREIAALKEQIGGLEEAALLAMERLESLESDSSGIAVDLEQRRDDISVQREQWAERGPQLQGRADELQGYRDGLLAEMTGEIRRLYSTALKRGPHGASPPCGITELDGFICCTCHKRQPPMWVNESRTWQRLYCCDGCKRILVFDPDGAVAAP